MPSLGRKDDPRLPINGCMQSPVVTVCGSSMGCRDSVCVWWVGGVSGCRGVGVF